MLRGQESLIRLVGKRRRFLPNRSSILSSPLPETCINLVDNDDRSKQEFAIQSSSSDWVSCPVCGRNVPGEPYSFNSHLDTCLTKGKKRKLTQRTLLQFNFSSKSSPKVLPDEVTKSEAVVVCEAVADDVTQDAVIAYRNYDDVASAVKELSTPEHVLQSGIEDEIANPVNDEVDLQVDCLPNLKNDAPKSDVSVSVCVDDIVGVTLETFIVGRKFSSEKELSQGAHICLSRDPNNAKDPNAVKVLLGDSSSCKALGFIPRDLAHYLSPLIEKYNFIFEGHLTSIPESSTDIVPIQIACRNTISHNTEDHSEIQAFSRLWKNVLHVIESGKNHVPKNAKYQQNFGLLIREVLQNSSHLFTEAERSLLESFFSLSNDSQRLFVRLYTRKGPWFRTSTLSYAEVVDHEQAIKELCAMGYLCSSEGTDQLQDDDVKNILNLLTVSELRDISCMFNKNSARCTRKQDLIATLSSAYRHGTRSSLLGAILDRTGRCVKISCKADSLIWRAERLFFVNGEQDLSAFLLVDLGIVKYPTYRCIISKPIFSDRCDLLAYEEAIEVAQIMDESLDANNVDSVSQCMKLADSGIPSSSDKAMCVQASESQPSFLSHFSASWVYSKVFFLGVSFLEHERRYKEAVVLLKKLLACFTCDGRRGIWTLRLSIDLEHMGYPEESLTVAEDGLKDPWVRAGSRMALQRRVLRLAKPPRRWKVPSFSTSVRKKIKEIHIQGRPLNCEAGVRSRFYGEDGEQCGVEQLALQYYAAEGGGWQGVHTESGIWLTIFGLLMWDIIFSEVPNVFYTRFQTAPLDLETDSFYPLRKSLIEPHVERIHNGMAEEILIASWESHMGTACRGVNWDRHSLSELRAAVACVGGPCLASLCRHLAQDYRSWSSGMPDLLLWRFSGEYRGEAKLVEVKGPRDRLSEQQRAWLLLLMDCGFNTEVCKVSPLPLSAVPQDSDCENN